VKTSLSRSSSRACSPTPTSSTPNHHPTIGWRGDVESIDSATLRRFYDTYYYPDNATVIIAGDVEPRPSLDLVAQFLAAIRPAPAPFPRLAITEGRQRGERRFVIERAAELGHLGCVWHGPRGLDDAIAPLTVAAQILAEGVTAKLSQRLVETNLCLAVHASVMESRDPGLFQVYATLAPGVEHERVEAEIRDVVSVLLREPAGARELARAKIARRTDLAFQWESPARLVSALTEAVAMGDWRAFVGEMDRIAAVEADSVVDACRRFLRPTNLTVGWFVPGPGAEAAP